MRTFGRLRCLVAGPWGDVSPDFHELLQELAEARVANQARARGHAAGEGDLGQAVGAVRRAISVTIMRSQSLCLLERLAYLGPGAKAAAERRRVTQQLEERRRRELGAYQEAHMRRGLRRVGRAFVP